MSTPVGGLRVRLTHDNLYDLVRDGLNDLGWLGANVNHDLVYVRQTQVGHEETVAPNIVCITVEDDSEEEAELGSNLTDHTWTYYIDVYGEDDALSLHLATDIRDILMGRFTQTVSRMGPNVDIYDLTTASATPGILFTVELENIDMNRSRFYEKPFQEHWRVVSFFVKDTYKDEDDL